MIFSRGALHSNILVLTKYPMLTILKPPYYDIWPAASILGGVGYLVLPLLLPVFSIDLTTLLESSPTTSPKTTCYHYFDQQLPSRPLNFLGTYLPIKPRSYDRGNEELRTIALILRSEVGLTRETFYSHTYWVQH